VEAQVRERPGRLPVPGIVNPTSRLVPCARPYSDLYMRNTINRFSTLNSCQPLASQNKRLFFSLFVYLEAVWTDSLCRVRGQRRPTGHSLPSATRSPRSVLLRQQVSSRSRVGGMVAETESGLLVGPGHCPDQAAGLRSGNSSEVSP
jgi:hypothetical protein